MPIKSKYILLRLSALRSAMKFLTRGSGASSKAQARAYLQALDDVEKVIKQEASNGQVDLSANWP